MPISATEPKVFVAGDSERSNPFDRKWLYLEREDAGANAGASGLSYRFRWVLPVKIAYGFAALLILAALGFLAYGFSVGIGEQGASWFLGFTGIAYSILFLFALAMSVLFLGQILTLIFGRIALTMDETGARLDTEFWFFRSSQIAKGIIEAKVGLRGGMRLKYYLELSPSEGKKLNVGDPRTEKMLTSLPESYAEFLVQEATRLCKIPESSPASLPAVAESALPAAANDGGQGKA
jgi:hypothetical protein